MKWPKLFKRKQATHYWYVPKTDITAYELARCVQLLLSKWPNDFEDYPESVKRHFFKVEPKP
jgi:23S rRNA maturation-related 3'-5' exoribonuclease YhaM